MAAPHYNIDMATPRPRASRWSVWLLLAGLAATVATARVLQVAHTERTLNEETLARLETALAKRSSSPVAKAVSALPAAERRLQTDLTRVSADLYRPWLPMFDALEASMLPQVHLQQLSVDSGFTRLQLQVDAPDLPALLHYVHELDSAGAPLQGAQLLNHEWQAATVVPRRLQARISVGLIMPSAVGSPPVVPAMALAKIAANLSTPLASPRATR